MENRNKVGVNNYNPWLMEDLKNTLELLSELISTIDQLHVSVKSDELIYHVDIIG